jgi:elongation factor G
LHQLREEDPTLLVEVSQELKQTLIHCQGDMHLAVAKWKIEKQHKLEVKFVKPKLHTGKLFARWLMQAIVIKSISGGAGQFGEVYMRIEPWYEGMPDPKDFTVRGRDIHDLDWGWQAGLL